MTEVKFNISTNSYPFLLQDSETTLLKNWYVEHQFQQDLKTRSNSHVVATLLASYPIQTELMVEAINFITTNNGKIINAVKHTDWNTELCFTRIEWVLDNFKIARHLIAPAVELLSQRLQARCQLHFNDTVPRIAIWVSRQDHCLLDLIWRNQAKEFSFEIPLVISNHLDLQSIAEQFNIEYHYIPINKENKIEQEAKQLELLQKHKIDLVVLAKYMQILSPKFIQQFPKIINIHHSLLPAFVGAKPYHCAYERGVKIIGATAHYVTADLDAGPIIGQDIVQVSHLDKIDDLIRKGKDLERLVLSRAVRLHLLNQVIVNGNSTVVFN